MNRTFTPSNTLHVANSNIERGKWEFSLSRWRAPLDARPDVLWVTRYGSIEEFERNTPALVGVIEFAFFDPAGFSRERFEALVDELILDLGLDQEEEFTATIAIAILERLRARQRRLAEAESESGE
jgi:hypothetical protein